MLRGGSCYVQRSSSATASQATGPVTGPDAPARQSMLCAGTAVSSHWRRSLPTRALPLHDVVLDVTTLSEQCDGIAGVRFSSAFEDSGLAASLHEVTTCGGGLHIRRSWL